ncbi:unnamed protein product [Lupinus luteus]|uniref:Uncharacterized protein n=1 Tax=Lupinus luteus TaxID=3873 RepID=A0AAV1WRQ0_LUPLU
MMVIHKIELCKTMVRKAIKFVIAVAEKMVTVEEETTPETLNIINQTNFSLRLSGLLQ